MLDAIVRAEKNRSERGPTLGLAGNVYGASAITRLGVATANYCDLLLLAFHARKTGALGVQTLLQGFTQKKSARYDRHAAHSTTF